MTMWIRRLRSRRWIRAWVASTRSFRPMLVVVIVGFFTTIVVATYSLNHGKHVDDTQVGLFLFAGIAVVVAMLALLPGRNWERRAREERRHKRRVEQRLARLVDILEQRTLGSVEQPPPPPPRRSPWILILVAVVVAWRWAKPSARR